MKLSRFFLFGILSFLAIGLVACSSSEIVRVPEPLVAGVEKQPLEQVWQLNIAKLNVADYRGLALAQDAERLYVSAGKGIVTALRKSVEARSDEQVVWQLRFEARVTAGPVVTDDFILVGTAKGDLLALHKATGKLAWQARLNSAVVSEPLVHEAKVYVRTSDGKIFNLYEASGELIWQVNSQMPNLFIYGAAPVIISDKAILVGRESGLLESLSLANGNKEWDVRVATPRGRTDLERMVDVQSKLILQDGRLFVMGYKGQLAAVNPANGNFFWAKDFSGYRDMLLVNNRLFVIDDKDILYSLDASSGTEYWSQPLFKYRLTSHLLQDQLNPNQLLVVDGYGVVHWLDAQDGGFIKRFNFSGNNGTGEKVLDWIQQGDEHYVFDSDGRVSLYKQVEN